VGPVSARVGSVSALARAIGDDRGRARGQGALRQMVADHLTQVGRLPALAPAWLQEPWQARGRFDHPIAPPLVEVRAMIAARARGKLPTLCCGFFDTVGAAGAVEARAIERRARGREAPALGGGRGDEAGACRHPRRVQRLEGTPERVIVEMARGHGRRVESRGRCMLKKMWHEVARLSDEAEAVEDHRLDRLACGHQPPCGVLWGCFLNDLGDAEVCKHPCDKTKMLEDGVVGGL